MADHVAARHVDLVGERDGHRLAGDGLVEVTVHRDDAIDTAGRPGRQHAHGVARTHGPADDLPGEPAEVEVGAVHPLHGHPEGLLGSLVGCRNGLEVSDQGRTVIPVRVLARRGDVVALQRRQRDERHLVEADLRSELAVLGLDAAEDRLGVVDEVHLVDRHDDALDAEQRHEVAVATGLGEHTAAGVDQDDGDVGRRGAGHHVAGVLLVSGGVGHDELALLGREEAVRDVDGDALLALGGKTVEQQREVEVATLRADLRRVGLRGPRGGPRRRGGTRTAVDRSACSCRRRRCRR